MSGLCRICMFPKFDLINLAKDGTDTLERSGEKFEDCFGIKVKELPFCQRICKDCDKQLIDFYYFKQQALRTHNYMIDKACDLQTRCAGIKEDMDVNNVETIDNTLTIKPEKDEIEYTEDTFSEVFDSYKQIAPLMYEVANESMAEDKIEIESIADNTKDYEGEDDKMIKEYRIQSANINVSSFNLKTKQNQVFSSNMSSNKVSSDAEVEEAYFTPPDIEEEADLFKANLLPEKSKLRYELVYEKFKKWKINNKVPLTTENAMLVYFKELSVTYKSSSLWSIYSMLKTTVQTNENVSIYDFKKLITFLKRQGEGYVAKKSKVFSSGELERFLKNAPDHDYLATKVVAVLGIAGACRKDEIVKLKVTDVKKEGDLLSIMLHDTKTNRPRRFIVDGEFKRIIEQYMSLRPASVSTDRFLLNLQKGKCTLQVIGRNKIGKMPQDIATFLGLEDPKSYTGHSFRRSSATLLADAGADLRTIKQHGGWKSDAAAKRYIANSINNKRKIGNLITSELNLAASSTISRRSQAPCTATSGSSIPPITENSNPNLFPITITTAPASLPVEFKRPKLDSQVITSSSATNINISSDRNPGSDSRDPLINI